MASADITKRAIADAMKKLMAEKPLAKISVADIVERCGMNRNSFYYHFKDKFDLVNWIFYAELAEEMMREEVSDGTYWTLVEGLCVYFYDNQVFYRNAFSVQGQNSFMEYFTDLMRQIVAARATDLYNDEAHQDFFIRFFADAFVLTCRRWLQDGAAMQPRELAGLLRKAVNGEAVREMEMHPGPNDAADEVQ